MTVLFATFFTAALAAEDADKPDDVRGGAVVEVWADPAVAKAREVLFRALKDEGYRKGTHHDDHTVFKSYSPWKPNVIVYDDGWVITRRAPPRIHSPGRSFADQGSPASYLWCVLAPTACVSIGGWMVSPRKLQAMEGKVLNATNDEVIALNNAVARRELSLRVNTDIPDDLNRIWSLALPPEERKALLFAYWDSRNDDEWGDSARDAIDAFIRGVVQQSDTPFTVSEIAQYNTTRTATRVFLPRPVQP